MKNLIYPLVLFSGVLFVTASCSEDETEPVEITAEDFSVTIDENPQDGAVIGTVSASVNTGTLSYSLSNQNPGGAMTINSSTGELSVLNSGAFDFETNPVVSATATVSGGQASEEVSITINLNDIDENSGGTTTGTIWTGAKITFQKASGADPSQETNQDRITENVWITRGNNGGQIYNAKTENSASKNTSPADTEWAVGTTSQLSSLTFTDFRSAIRPKNIVGQDLVVHLITDDIYIDVKFTQWASNKQGGFAYDRSTP
jgi:hypothetical protein